MDANSHELGGGFERSHCSAAALLNVLDEDYSGKRNGSVPTAQFLWIVCVPGDEVLSHKGVKGAAALGVIKWQRCFVLQGHQLSAPVGYDRVVPHPNFVWMRIEFVPQTEGEDFGASKQKKVSVRVGLRIGVVRSDKIGKAVVSTKFGVRHIRILT
jgi:hypothetical protein